VDHYRPKYFLLENVEALLHHRLGSTQVNIHKTKGGIEMGSAKFIIRALTSLGYQVQFSALQAGEHGTPQSRKRVFFWGSAPGYPLPKYPEPTHIFPGAAPKTTRRTRRAAPHASVSIGDALSDLPAFDWKMQLADETDVERVARERQQLLRTSRINQIPIIIGTNARIGADIQQYASRNPLSEFQRQLRRNVKTKIINNAYTCCWNDTTMARVLRIPMNPGASHNDIDAKYDMSCLRSEKGAAPRHKYYPDRYQRLDYEKQFQTCLTDINPSGKNGKVSKPCFGYFSKLVLMFVGPTPLSTSRHHSSRAGSSDGFPRYIYMGS
jgi:site-specific DNA-cytosine methylase